MSLQVLHDPFVGRDKFSLASPGSDYFRHGSVTNWTDDFDNVIA